MPRPTETSRPDLYTRVTNAIIADLETGVRPWTKPWTSGSGPISRPLRSTGEAYSGINIVLLWSRAVEAGYSAPNWMTFRQALALGAAVRKGERGTTVVYANRFNKSETSDDGQDVERSIPFLKAYTVFNAEQVEGLEDRFYARPEPQLDPAQRVAHADAFFLATGASVRHGGGHAYYAPGPDHVQMPPFEVFADPEAYYATLAHECTHWTGHEARLNRTFGKRFGDEAYAAEELVAELGAAFLCADLGLELTPRADHASYIGHWLKALKNDRRLIFTAAAHAQKAADFLHLRLAQAAA